MKKYRFPVIVSGVQVALCGLVVMIAYESSQLTGTDSWIIFYAIPIVFIASMLAPIVILSAIYYLIRYAKESKKLTVLVVVALVVSLLAIRTGSSIPIATFMP